MRRHFLYLLSMIIALVLLVSCSTGGSEIVTPGANAKDATVIPVTPMTCAGFRQVIVNTSTGTIEAVDLRTGDLMLNVLSFLEPPALKGMTINFDTLAIDPVESTISVDVILTHPITSPEFKGFDVRGVVFGPRLTNADGLTVVPGPEFFTGVPFGYQDGLLGAPATLSNFAGYAGYKYFCDGLGLDDDLADFMSDPGNLAERGVFSEGPKRNSRHYVLDWTNSEQDFFVFNYAIYANYNWPVGDPPFDLQDFDISTANSAEAFCGKFTEISNSLYYSDGYGGGSISLDVEIWDWQGLESTGVGINTWDGSAPASYDSWETGGTAFSGIYHFVGYTPAVNSSGRLEIVVTATDEQTFGENWFLGLLPTGHEMYDENIFNGFLYIATVNDCPVPTVESTDPPFGAGVLDDVIFNCTGLVDGPTLGVKLTDGVTDWIGTDVHYINATQMRADLDLSTATIGEELDITITNGCGTWGTGPSTWFVLYYIQVVDDPNINVVGSRTPRDIAIDPTSDQVAIVYNNFWINWTNDYQNSSPEHYSWANQEIGCMDAQADLIWYSHAYYGMYGGNYLAWSWADFTGWQSTHSQWQPANDNRVLDMANLQGTNELYAAFHWFSSGISIMMTYADYNISYPAHTGPPFYNGDGDTGVVVDNLRAIDMPEYSGSGKPDMYFLEAIPDSNTGVVEKWHIDYTPTFLLAFGEDTLYDPLDVTVDESYNVYILEENSSGNPEIWAYNPSGTLIGRSGELSTSEISGDPLRIEAHIAADPDEVHVLHTNGVTKFSMY